MKSMTKAEYSFKTKDPELTYNPKKCIFVFYQICAMSNPKNKKYTIRKFYYDEYHNIVNIRIKDYEKNKVEKFMARTPTNKYKCYATYDLDMIDYPNLGNVIGAKSDLLN